MFILRRLIFLVCAFKLNNHSHFQFAGFYFSNLAYAVFIGFNKPKVYWVFNYQEQLNELLTQLVTIQLVIFSDFVLDEEVKFLMGWVLVATMALLVGSNLLLVFYSAVRALFFVCIKYYRRVRKYFDPYFMMTEEQIKLIEDFKELQKQKKNATESSETESSSEDELVTVPPPQPQPSATIVATSPPPVSPAVQTQIVLKT